MMIRKLVFAAAAISSLGLTACDGTGTGDDQYVTGTELQATPRDGAEVEIYRSEKNDQFYFRLEATNGETILSSEGYASLEGATNGAESLQRNGISSGAYQLKPSSANPDGRSGGQWYFNVTAANGAVIGTSEMYSTKSSAKRGAETVMGYLLGETMLDYWTDQCGFELYVGGDDAFWFRLRADNGENLLRSEGYSSEGAAKTGIDTVVTVAIQAGWYEDGLPAFDIVETDGGWYWNLLAANGEVVGASSETFSSYEAAEGSVAIVMERAETMIACWTTDAPTALAGE